MPQHAREDQPVRGSGGAVASPSGGTVLDEQTRADRLRDLMADRDLLGVVASSFESVCYLADADIRSQLMIPERLAFFVLPASGESVLLLCNIDESQARAQTAIPDIRSYVEFEEDPTVALARLLTDLGMTRGRLGVEASRLPTGAAWTLARELPSLELVGVDREIAELHARKSASEVERLGALARDLLHALDEAIAHLNKKVTEAEFSRELLRRVGMIGGTPMFVQLAAGRRALLGHPDAEPASLDEGTLWRTDYGTRLPGGLCGDVARTGVVGSASAIQDEIFSIVHAAQHAAIAIAEPGRPARDLFHACRDTFDRNHLPFVAPHVGHGIGFGLHEAPLLQPYNDAPLAPGTVLMVEPFVLIGDRGEAYHTEDMVVVTGDGPEQMTTPQHALIPLT